MAFGPRYAELLLEIHRCLAREGGYEPVYRALTQFTSQGGPRGAADHVRALATSFKKAVYCKECKDGKVACSDCKGKGRVDQLKCSVCNGAGRVRPPGAVGAVDLTMKCRNCDGHGTFRDAGCPACSRTGQKNCLACLGRPWHDRRCAVAECRDGRIRCADCGGKGSTHPKCPDCEGKGRFRPAGAIGNTDVSVKCRSCEGKGVVSDPVPCPSCASNGFAPCKACRSDDRPRFHVDRSEIFSSSPCPACSGKGAGCAKCAGLGLRVQPAADPSKTLD
jgi:DnaJ-class molecular chaperone